MHKGRKIASVDRNADAKTNFFTVSPFVSIFKAQAGPDALNKVAHFACYLITVMMLLSLYFRDAINPEKKFDKLLVAGILFSLSITIVVKYFLGSIKSLL